MRFKIAVVLLITLLCLGWVVSGIDPEQLQVSLAGARWGWLLPMVGIYVCAHALRSLRLGLLLGDEVSFVGLFSITSIGFLAINVVPLRLGEFVRPYLLLQAHQIPFGQSLAAILVERLLDMTMLLGMLLLVGWVVDLPVDGVVVAGIDVVSAGQRFAGTLSAVGFAGVLALLLAGPRVVPEGERHCKTPRVKQLPASTADPSLSDVTGTRLGRVQAPDGPEPVHKAL